MFTAAKFWVEMPNYKVQEGPDSLGPRFPRSSKVLKNLGTEEQYYTRKVTHCKAAFFLSCRMAVAVKVRVLKLRKMMAFFLGTCSFHGHFCTQHLQKFGTCVCNISNQALVYAMCLREGMQEEQITSTVFSCTEKEPLFWNRWKQLSGQSYLPEGITMEKRSNME